MTTIADYSMNSELAIALMLPDRLSQVVMQLFKDAACVISVNRYLSVGSERNMVTDTKSDAKITSNSKNPITL